MINTRGSSLSRNSSNISTSSATNYYTHVQILALFTLIMGSVIRRSGSPGMQDRRRNLPHD